MLWYEVSGTGPTLLVLAAGIDDAAAAAPFADRLRDAFTMLRYDRRGISRSQPGLEQGADSPLAVHADDAAALIDEVAGGPVYVFGASIGALIGLELVSRHPAKVSAAILHEPPLEYLVLNPERTARLDEVAVKAQTDPIAAIRGFGEIVMSGDVREPDAPAPPRPSNPQETIPGFLSGDFDAVRCYQVDETAVGRSADKLLLTDGSHSEGRFEALCSAELAGRLGVKHATIATGHSPMVDFPATTADFVRAHWG